MKAIGDHPRQSRSRRISAFSGAWTPAPSLYTDVHKKLHKKWRAFVISLCITVILAPVSADRCMMFLPRRYDGCRPASLPTTSPLHAAMRQGARVRADRLPVVYGTATSSESSSRSGSPAPAPPVRAKRRRQSCPPRRSSISFGAPRMLVGYPYQDIIGIDPGALPTEVTPLLNAPCRHDGAEDLKATGESRWDAAVREMGMLLRYTGPIFGCVVGSLALWYCVIDFGAGYMCRSICCLSSLLYSLAISRRRALRRSRLGRWSRR